MRRELAGGLLAGAAGTMALDVTTYLDMALRGRPSSSIPAKAAGELAGRVGVDLGDGEVGDSRRQGVGALLGYATGIGVGVGYGLLRTRVARPPLGLGAVALGLVAMAGSDTPLTALGLTDPRTWGVAGWVSDLVPHLVYGGAAVVAFEVVVGDR